METESALVAAARLGNRQAFEQLYRLTAPALTTCARRLSRNEADDLVQATYLRALRAMRSFRGECRVLTWLCTILRNEATTRTQYMMKHPTTELLDIFEAPRPDLDAFVDLQKALSVLSQADRELILRHLQGYRDAEIAGQLGLPGDRSTLRVQMWRAQRKMRSALMQPVQQSLPHCCEV
jgi:RNA polymerase sigma-70 factor (ECF subfamily)